ncbi:citrate lyase acyl carrier protein [Fusibacter ferrireducens]|uniref:Citrate lyase acyl carrier protein n=1 Tax=Fusibacter ferrireducens TaxID=2785058 RepID=A0ABR9ZUG8_9FIRM|nr:citrate lyase acyl carrier protein [Fusibacter ferrireducens]MBF4694097.1 citrate lyase acyl carrier protein [Fusibacter ferrireducens]
MRAMCGTEDASDVLVSVLLEGRGIVVNLKSKNKPLFGRMIEIAVRETCLEMNIENAIIEVKDFGALDFVIKARTKTAVRAALKQVN